MPHLIFIMTLTAHKDYLSSKQCCPWFINRMFNFKGIQFIYKSSKFEIIGTGIVKETPILFINIINISVSDNQNCTNLGEGRGQGRAKDHSLKLSKPLYKSILSNGFANLNCRYISINLTSIQLLPPRCFTKK